MAFADCGHRWAILAGAFLVGFGLFQPTSAQPANSDLLAGYQRLPSSERADLEGASPLEALSGLVRWPEEPHDGARLSVGMRRAGDVLVADIEIRGYLDDSVLGENFRAIVAQGDEGRWHVEAVGRQTICARGSQAGLPTSGVCP